jgi:methylmalonyl-CoA/ethylmalonyl-CoA epimerase
MRTVATTGAGVADLVAMIDKFREHTSASQIERRRTRAEWRLREILGRRFMQHLEQAVLAPGEFDRLLDRIAARDVDPYAAAESVIGRALASGAETRSAATGFPLDHVGIAVKDATPFVALFARLLGLSTDQPEVVGSHRLRFVEAGGVTLELIEAVTDEAPVAKFLSKRGEALHHLCFRVADIDATVTTLLKQGVRFIDEQPRPGAHGSRIAFIHPSSAGGLLVELKQVKG